MRVIIIEDELLAQSKLEAMLKTIDPSIEVLARLGSVQESIDYLSSNRAPDLAFVDIQLSDDHSFEIFRRHNVDFPIVFTTAYDKYLLESFEHNAIDYILKPITEERLRRSISRLKKLELHFIQGQVKKMLETPRTHDRIVARKGSEFVTLPMEDIAYFFTEHKVVFVRDKLGRQFMLDKTLSDLEQTLDGKHFFRLNRKYVANVGAIEKFRSHSGKVRIFLKPAVNEEVFVSKETAPDFRRWIGS